MTNAPTRRKLVTSLAAASLALTGALLTVTSGSSAAATLTPTTTADDLSAGSLRSVLESAADGDTVALAAGATYQLTQCGPGAINPAATVTVEGNGATIVQTCTTATPTNRVITAQAGITLHNVTISGGNLTGDGGGVNAGSVTPTPVIISGTNFVNNTASGSGGGLASAGVLTITNSSFVSNTAGVSGGGAIVRSTNGATITGSIFDKNSAAAFGGAFESLNAVGSSVSVPVSISNSVFTSNTAANRGGGAVDTDQLHTVTVSNSSFTGNHGGGGGGVTVFGGDHLTVVGSTFNANISDDLGGAAVITAGGTGSTASFVNSTITGNTEGEDGAITVGGTLTLTYATITGNTTTGILPGATAADSRSFVHAAAVDNAANVQAVDLASFGTVITGPIGGPNCFASNPPTSNGYNFSDDASCGFTGTGDRQSAGDPGLGAVGANGGPTLTQLPAAGSPLLDVIPLAACQADGAAGVATDQRGISRPQGTGCDVGAVEVVVEAAAAVIEIVPRFTG